MTDRQVGGADLTVDVRPVEAKERQVAASVLNVDVRVPQGVQYGSALLNVEVTTNPARWLGNIALMVDYVAGLATAGIGWSGSQFIASGGTPVLWGASAFQSSGGYPAVTWEDDHFAEAE